MTDLEEALKSGARPVKETDLQLALKSGAKPFEAPKEKTLKESILGGLLSSAMGASQGYSGDFTDELSGATGKLIGRDYNQQRDAVRKLDELAKEKYPKTYNISKFVGGMANPVNAFTGKNPVLNIAKDAVMGGLQSLGASNDNETVPKDVLTGSLLAGGLSGVSQAAPKVLRAAKETPLGQFLSQAANTGIDKAKNILPNMKKGTEDFIASKIMNLNPEDIKTFRDPESASKILSFRKEKTPYPDQVAEMFKKVTEQRNKFSDEARSKLGEVPQYSPQNIIDSFKKIEDANKIVNPATKETIPINLDVDSTINNLKSEIGRFPELSEKQLKDITLSAIRDKAKYNVASGSEQKANSALKKVGHEVDQLLKKNNPSYEEAMKNVAPRQDFIENIAPKYGYKEMSGMPTDFDVKDKLILGLRRAGDENKFDTVKDFLRLGNLANEGKGKEFVKDLRLRALDARTNGGQQYGSAQTNQGAATGFGLGNILGTGLDLTKQAALGATSGAVGALTGRVIDKSGRSLAKNYLLNRAAKNFKPQDVGNPEWVKSLEQSPIGQTMLQKATQKMQNGNFSVPAATAFKDYLGQESFLNSQIDPEYRKFMKGNNK